MAPARGIWLVPEFCELSRAMVGCVAAHRIPHGPYWSSLRWIHAESRAAWAQNIKHRVGDALRGVSRARVEVEIM
jgi:hypothetical protein